MRHECSMKLMGMASRSSGCNCVLGKGNPVVASDSRDSGSVVRNPPLSDSDVADTRDSFCMEAEPAPSPSPCLILPAPGNTPSRAAELMLHVVLPKMQNQNPCRAGDVNKYCKAFCRESAIGRAASGCPVRVGSRARPPSPVSAEGIRPPRPTPR